MAGGAGSEHTIRVNLKGYTGEKINPQVLEDVDEGDLSIELFAAFFTSQLLDAAIGAQSIIPEDGEIGSVLACAHLGVPDIASSASTVPVEKIAEAMGDAPRWFQLYWSRDPDI